MKLNYKNRISLRLIIASALIVALSFFIIYEVAHWTILFNIDQRLSEELKEHEDQISIIDGEVRFVHKGEWEEREHREIQFNPIYIEIVDKKGNSLDKSPNLGEVNLLFRPDYSDPNKGFNLSLKQGEVRQMQIALNNGDQRVGYLMIATSFSNQSLLLNNLKKILFLLFPLILFSLYLTLRYLAGKSIEPVLYITEKAKEITTKNINERIQLPKHQDEIKDLSMAINDLLDRLEKAMEREKQFTSDASHELRTPLSVLKGNFEVLIRKSREPQEYVSKITSGLKTIDHLNSVLDQLLSLARLQTESIDLHEVDLIYLVEEIVGSVKEHQNFRNISIENQLDQPVYVLSNENALSMVFHNLLENSLKYSQNDSDVQIQIKKSPTGVDVDICDHGIGIEPEHIRKIFNPFFRGDSSQLGRVKGAGLGLSIVKRLCDDLKIQIEVKSEKDNGTIFTLKFDGSLIQS
jgi:signal transduction histidine kinase